MANATIDVTACDNELYLIAVNSPSGGGPNQSFQLLHIESGNGNSVNVTATVSPGTYVEPATLDGVDQPLGPSSDYTVSLPAGSYNLVAVGINWGGPQNFSFTLNDGEPITLPLTNPNPSLPTVVWTPTAVAFAVD